MSNLGELLCQLRGSRSLREVERKCGISNTYLSSLEKDCDPRSGKPRKPTPETLKLLSEFYKYPYLELMKVAGYFD